MGRGVALAWRGTPSTLHASQLRVCPRWQPAHPLGIGGPGLCGPADASALLDTLTAAAAAVSRDGDTPRGGRAAAVASALHEAQVAASAGADECWWLSPEQAAMVQRFQPGLADAEDTIGFFVARFANVGGLATA